MEAQSIARELATRLEPGDSIENTEVGEWYIGEVNATEPWGFFVTLAKADKPGTRQDFSGLVHHSNLPEGFPIRKVEKGATVVVERLSGGKDGNAALALVQYEDTEILREPPEVIRERAEAAGYDHVPTEETEPREEPVSASDGGYVCEECGKEFEEKKQLIGHMGGAHGERDTDADGPFEERVDTYEKYWQWVDKVRWYRDLMRKADVDKEDVHRSPLVREYLLAVSKKFDWQEDAHDLARSLPVYREQFKSPSWPHKQVELKEDPDPCFVPAGLKEPPVVGDVEAEFVAAEDIEKRLASIEDHLDSVSDDAREAVHAARSAGGDNLDNIERQLNAIEAAVTNRDSREEGTTTLVLTDEQLLKLIREAPEDVAAMAMEAMRG